MKSKFTCNQTCHAGSGVCFGKNQERFFFSIQAACKAFLLSIFLLAGASLNAATITSRGKTETCAACHTDYKDRDFVSKRITIPGDAPAPPPTQLSSGRVVLHAVRATVLGKNLRYEPPQNKNTLGFWTDPADSASWTFSIHTPGKFDVEVVQGCGKGSGDALVEVSFAPLNADKSPPPIAPLKFTVKDTGHFQNFVPRSIGTVTLPAAGLWSVTVQPRSKPGPAVMDLQSINLSPIPK
jgi:hypothetical protein